MAVLSSLLVPGSAPAHLSHEQDLDFGAVPQGSEVLIGPMDDGAARLEARLVGSDFCGVPMELEIVDLPMALTSRGGATIPLVWGPSSGRVWETSNPGHFLDWNPANQTLRFPADATPASIGLGAGLEVPADAPMGEYTARFRLHVGYEVDTGSGCQPRSHHRWVRLSAVVQSRLAVVAETEIIDVGMLVPGMIVSVPADGSGEQDSAPFVVTGSDSLDLVLTVTTRNLLHSLAADELSLSFDGGLYGLDAEPDAPFTSGQLVPATDHQGLPLYVRCGFTVSVPPDATQGHYRGEIILSVEVLLN